MSPHLPGYLSSIASFKSRDIWTSSDWFSVQYIFNSGHSLEEREGDEAAAVSMLLCTVLSFHFVSLHHAVFPVILLFSNKALKKLHQNSAVWTCIQDVLCESIRVCCPSLCPDEEMKDAVELWHILFWWTHENTDQTNSLSAEGVKNGSRARTFSTCMVFLAGLMSSSKQGF